MWYNEKNNLHKERRTMNHYFCQSCGGMDDSAHACQTSGCDREGHDLAECECDDPDSHKKSSESKSGDEPTEETSDGDIKEDE